MIWGGVALFVAVACYVLYKRTPDAIKAPAVAMVRVPLLAAWHQVAGARGCGRWDMGWGAVATAA